MLTQPIPTMTIATRLTATELTANELINAIWDADLEVDWQIESGYCPDTSYRDGLITEYERRFNCKIAVRRNTAWLIKAKARRCGS